jgi:hypothetical protein
MRLSIWSHGSFLVSLALFSIAFLPYTLSLQESLVGVADWHKALIGRPLLDPSPPSFVDTPRGRRIVALTEKNVFACLDAGDGLIVWRHQMGDRDPVVSYHVSPDTSSTHRFFLPSHHP